jgi:hypothetical protein
MEVLVAYIGGSNPTGSIFQTPGATVGANTTYTLTVTIGARADEVFTGHFAALGAGNVTLAFRRHFDSFDCQVNICRDLIEVSD